MSKKREQAWHAAAAAWRASRWPNRPCTAEHFQRIQHCLCRYLEASFPGRFNPDDVSEFAKETLLNVMSPVYAGRLVATERRFETLLEELLDRALDEPLHRSDSPRASERRPPSMAPDTVAQDDQLARKLFQTEASEVRAALGELIEEGAVDEFRIVTFYLNLSQRRPGWEPSPSEVAAELNDHLFRLGPSVNGEIVETALKQFRERSNRAPQ